jgi:hypothetical protein
MTVTFKDLDTNIINNIYEYANIWKPLLNISLTKIKFNYIMFQINLLGGDYENTENINLAKSMLLEHKKIKDNHYEINKHNENHLIFVNPVFRATTSYDTKWYKWGEEIGYEL